MIFTPIFSRQNRGRIKSVSRKTKGIIIPFYLDYIMSLLDYENQTEEICIKEIKKDVWNFRFVKNVTPAIALATVKVNGLWLMHISEQSEEICLAAVQQNGKSLEYVKNQTEEICIEAVATSVIAFLFVKEQTEKICRTAYALSDGYFHMFEFQPEDMSIDFVSNRTEGLIYVKNQTYKIVKAAHEAFGDSVLEYVDYNRMNVSDHALVALEFGDKISLQ